MEMTLYKRIIISLSSIALLTCINAEAQSQIKEDTKKRAFESEFIQTVATYQAGDFTVAGKKFKAAPESILITMLLGIILHYVN